MILVGVIANRVVMQVDDVEVEMDVQNACSIAARLLEAAAYIEAGVTVAPTFGDFMRTVS